jgi:hypothetical protein
VRNMDVMSENLLCALTPMVTSGHLMRCLQQGCLVVLLGGFEEMKKRKGNRYDRKSSNF